MPPLGNELVDEFLVMADELANVRVGRAALQEVRRRRAISAAYYAVFHALASICVDAIVGWEASPEIVDLVYRSLDHRPTRDRLRQRSIVDIDPGLASVGTAFARLLEKREMADYARGV